MEILLDIFENFGGKIKIFAEKIKKTCGYSLKSWNF